MEDPSASKTYIDLRLLLRTRHSHGRVSGWQVMNAAESRKWIVGDEQYVYRGALGLWKSMLSLYGLYESARNTTDNFHTY